MSEPGFGVSLLDDVVVDGAGTRAQIRDAIRDASYTRRIDGASELRLVLHDPDRTLMRDPDLFRADSYVELGDLRFDLVALATGAATLEVDFEDAVARRLRDDDAALAVSGGTQTRSEFARRLLAGSNVDAVVEPDPGGERVQFARSGSDEDDTENSWEALERLARDASRETGRDWRRFSTGREVVFASDEWLLDQWEAPEVRESDAGVQRITWTLDRGRNQARAEITAMLDEWSVPPGRPVRLTNQGPASGVWLIEQIQRRQLGSRETRLRLVRAHS